ncbi:MAG TPA: TVP38/TMEM64 family protein [Stellaceae bacterium]|nr:TVP38/TMEM64 family protein [Stellaceae bacterium]
MDQEGNPAPEPAGIKRWLPLAVLVAAGIAAWLSGAHRYVSFHALEAHREWILAQVAALGVWAPLAFIALYATVAALSIPGATIMTLSGGFLFGTVLGTLFNVLGATIGATLVFLVARSAFGEVLHRRAGPFLKKVEEGFRRDAVSYLLVLRLVPLFPFWLVNLVPALFGMSLGAYVLCTFFGILPGAVVYTSVGGGLGEFLDRGEKPDLHLVFQRHILLPLIGLGLLALVPVAYKRWKRKP